MDKSVVVNLSVRTDLKKIREIRRERFTINRPNVNTGTTEINPNLTPDFLSLQLLERR